MDITSFPRYKSKYAIGQLPPIPANKESRVCLYKSLLVLEEILAEMQGKYKDINSDLIKMQKYETCIEVKECEKEVEKEKSWMAAIRLQIEEIDGKMPEEELIF